MGSIPWISLVVWSLLGAAEPSWEAVTMDGRSIAGALTSMTADAVELTTSQGQVVRVAVKDVISLAPQAAADTPPAQQPSVWIELVDGSALSGASYQTADGKASVGLLDGTSIDLPLRCVRIVRFSDPEAAPAGWAEGLKADAAGDLIAIRRQEAVDFLEGIVGKVGPDSVELEIDGERIPVKRERIDGMIYAHRRTDQPAVLAIVEDVHGGRWMARQAKIDDAGVEVVTVAGATIRLPVSRLRRMDYSAGKVVYLSDLVPERFEVVPFFNLVDRSPAYAQYLGLRRDQGRGQPALSLGGRSYSKGIALTSRSMLVYRLPSGSRRFQGLAGLDDSVAGQGHVRLEIRGDDRPLLERVIGGDGQPLPIDLDVAGIRRLTIVVDYGVGYDVGDYLNIVDARIVK
jgi:hypothetical protein